MGGLAIHVEIDVICMILLAAIAWQSLQDVNQEIRRVLFRWHVVGIFTDLLLDLVWILIDGKMFPGAIALNKVLNTLILSMGVTLGGVWYLYVLESMKYRMTPFLRGLVLSPGLFFLCLNVLSIWTEWIFRIDANNVYIRGPLFWLQAYGAIGILLISLFHILFFLFIRHKNADRPDIRKLLWFYIIPVLGTLSTIRYTGMPGTWTCASVSVVLIYLDNQDREILTDSLTGLNNRKNLGNVYADYVKQIGPGKQLYLFMMDLDDFKGINDTLGHAVGDRALIDTARILKKTAGPHQSIVTRYGGDEFLILGFFEDDADAENFKKTVQKNFDEWNETTQEEYRLKISCGFSRCSDAKPLNTLIEEADAKLYEDKIRRKREMRRH